MAVPMANDPPFATLNHFAADLGIPSESDLLRIGISSSIASDGARRQCAALGLRAAPDAPHGLRAAARPAESSPNQTYRRNDVSEIHHRFDCHGCNRLCCVRAPALIDFRRGLRVRLLQLAAVILGGFLSAYDHRHLDRNARMPARIWQANR